MLGSAERGARGAATERLREAGQAEGVQSTRATAPRVSRLGGACPAVGEGRREEALDPVLRRPDVARPCGGEEGGIQGERRVPDVEDEAVHPLGREEADAAGGRGEGAAERLADAT